MTTAQLLLVDDSAETALLVRHWTRRLPVEVVAWADAERAWQYLQRHSATLALVDVHLPGASGLDFCRWVRASPLCAQLPLALFSHWQRPQDIAAGLGAGAHFVLAKDLLCQPAEWQARLTEILAWIGGQRLPFSLSWKNPLSSEQSLARRFNHMIRHQLQAQLGAEVVQVLLQRTLAEVADPACRLTADGCALEWEARGHRMEAALLRRFVSGFVEHLWYLVGTAGCVRFLEGLTAQSTLVCEPAAM